MTSNEITVGSLFSGIGGIELDLDRAKGFRTLWFVENNTFSKKILLQHWKEAIIYDDITKINWEALERVDMLTGGFPCQDISIAGKKAGIKEGTRSGLWSHFAKAIRILQPKFVLIENVSEITNRGLNIVLADLAKEGYDAEWFDLRASDFGALHKRERIFIIAFDPARIRCNNWWNNSRHGQVQKTPERKMEEAQQARNRRKSRNDEGINAESTNTNSKRRRGRSHEEPTQEKNDAEIQRRSHPLILTNDWSKQVQRFKQEKIQRKQGFSWCKDVRRIEDLQDRPNIPKPLFRRIDSRLSAELDTIKGEIEMYISLLNPPNVYGNALEEYSEQNLFDVQKRICPKKNREKDGRLRHISKEKILQYEMQWRASEKEESFQKRISEKSENIEKEELRNMWCWGKPEYSSQKRKMVGQSVREPPNIVFKMPFKASLGKWKETLEKSFCLHCLWVACEEMGFLPKTLSEVQEIWESIDDESKIKIILRVDSRKINDYHTDRVKAIGNAVVPECTEFIGGRIKSINQ